MTAHECFTGCGRPVQDATICSTCTDDLERDLLAVAIFRDELETTLSRQAVMGERNGGKSAEVPMAYHPGASEALDVLRSTLVGWVRIAVEEDGADWPENTLDAMADLLACRLNWLRRHQAAPEAVDEIHAAVSLARRMVDRPPPRWYAGPCHEDFQGSPCAGQLYARPGATEVVCPTCEAIHDVAARRDWLRQSVKDHLGTASEISALCRSLLGDLVTSAMIRGYAHRGSIAPHGETVDPRGRTVPLYRLDDVFTAAAIAGGDSRSRREARKAAQEAAEDAGDMPTHDVA